MVRVIRIARPQLHAASWGARLSALCNGAACEFTDPATVIEVPPSCEASLVFEARRDGFSLAELHVMTPFGPVPLVMTWPVENEISIVGLHGLTSWRYVLAFGQEVA